MNWYAFVARARCRIEILDYWNRELVKVLKDPAIAAELAKHGLEPATVAGREEFARYIVTRTEKWGKVVRSAQHER